MSVPQISLHIMFYYHTALEHDIEVVHYLHIQKRTFRMKELPN